MVCLDYGHERKRGGSKDKTIEGIDEGGIFRGWGSHKEDRGEDIVRR